MVRDWRSPRVRAKRAVSGQVLRLLESTGRLQRRTAAETTTRQADTVSFLGDVPRRAGPVPSQRRVVYAAPVPAVETVTDLVYTPGGHAWLDGRLIERLSLRSPSVSEVLARPDPATAQPALTAWLLESQTPYTYGDWVGDGIRALVHAGPEIGPVALPAMLQKGYVRRDLARLGLDPLEIGTSPIRIARAHVLRKQVPSYYWGPKDVAAYRARLGIVPPVPRPGSLVYLSRQHVKSEVVARSYPSAQVARIVEGLGGTVFDTSQASPEAFEALAGEVETVIADQGSAIFGVLQWNTARLLEITTDDWWHNSNIFFADGAGVERYAVLVCERYEGAALEARLRDLLGQIGFPDLSA